MDDMPLFNLGFWLGLGHFGLAWLFGLVMMMPFRIEIAKRSRAEGPLRVPRNPTPELIQGPGVLPNRGDKSIYKRYTKIGL